MLLGTPHATSLPDATRRFGPSRRAPSECSCPSRLAVFSDPYALNRGTILLDCFDPISEPLSKLFVLLDLGFHGLIRTSSDTTGLLRSVELGVLAGGPKKKVTIVIAL
jgi:hypothetical protein